MKSQEQLSRWTFEDERAYLENLVCQRFNFLLVFFGLVVASAVTAQDRTLALIVLWLGAVVMFLLAITVAGVHRKFKLVLEHIYEDKESPITIISEDARRIPFIHAKLKRKKHINWLIGYVVPFGCAGALLVGAYLGTKGVLNLGHS